MTETSRSVMGRSCVARVALLSMLAVGALVAIPALRASASEWVAASSYEDPEGKWVNETKAYDLNTSTYAEDRSNRLGWGAVLKLNYATPVTSDRVRVSTDFGYSVVDKLKLKVTYADDTSETREFDGTVVQNVTFSTLTFTKGSVKSVELSYNYLATGWYWWLYELQLYQCPPDPDPLAGQTLDPSSVNATSAVLHGQVTSSGGAPCYGRFKYWADGGDPLYTTWRSDLGTGQEFTAAVTGLTENQGYSYQTQLSPNAEPTPEQIVACDPVKTFTAVKVTEQTGPEWVSPSLASSEGGVWVNPACAMDDDEGTSTQWYHDVGADVWSPFISLATDLQSNGIRLKADGTNTDLVDIDIKRDGEWFHVYEGIFTGGVWQQFPFEKGAVTEARVRLRCSASYLGCFLKLIEVDFHQGEELRPTRYFVGPGADWNSAANWSASSGGTGGASVPGTGCVAIFDTNSPSCTLSGNISVEVLRLDAGFTGSLDAGGSSIVIERNRGFGELRVAGGELKLGTGTHTIRDNLRYLAGTITPGTSTVLLYAPNDGVYSVDGDFELNNVHLCHSGTGSNHKRVAVSGQLSVAGLLTLDGYESGGWHTYLEGSGSILAKGNIAGNSKVLRGTANLMVCGAADQTQTNLVWGTSGTYTVDKPSGTFYWAGTVKFGDATTSANSNVKIVLETPVDATTNTPSVWFCGYGEGDVTLTGPLTVYDLTFYRPGGTGNTVFDFRGETVTVENDLTIDCVGGGGWKVKAIGGTLSCRKDILAVNVTETYFEGITLKLTGTTAQTVDLQGLKVLSFLNENTGGVLTLVSGLTAVDTIGLPGGSSVVFGAGATFTTNKVAFLGTVANPVTLRSTVDGTAWMLNVATRYQCPECVDVKDSDASGGQTITAIESIDQGNNTNWSFYARVDLGITSPAASVTSPAWVQGQCGPNITELTVKVNGGEEFNAVRTAMMRWYADSASSPMGIPLSATAATQVEVTGRDIVGNSQTVSQNITWTATDLAGLTPANVVRIRKGDSLLLAATDSSGTGTTLEIDGDGDGVYEHSGDTEATFAHQYNTAGTYVAKAKVDGVEIGSITVVVISIDLKGPIACQVGYQRVKSILVSPAAEAANVVFTGEFSGTDPNYELQVSVKDLTVEGANLYIKALKRGTPIVYARLGADGPVIAKQEVDEFTLDVPAHATTLVNGSTSVGQSVVTMRPYIPELRQYFHMFGSQSTFGGGVTSFYAYTSTDYQQVWDPATQETVGTFSYNIEVPPGEDSYCFTLNTQQNDSTTWNEVSTEGTVNGDAAKISIGKALLFMREDNNEDAATEQEVETWESHGNNPAAPVAPRKLSFIEEGNKGYWYVEVDTDRLSGHSVDRSYSAPAGALYDSKANFKSYKPPYAASQEGEEFRWPLDGAMEPFNNELGTDRIPYVPGVQFGDQDMTVTAVLPGMANQTMVIEKVVTVARLEVDGAVPADPEQPVSNSNVTASTRDPFPRVIGELPERQVEYVEIEDPGNPEQMIPNAKPVAILKVAGNQAIWSGSGPLSVVFDASASYDPDAAEGEALAYEWDYEGDGNWESGTASGSHSYAARVSPYLPRLRVSDVHGTESQVVEFQRIIVHNVPTDPEPELPAVVAEPLGIPVQVTLFTAPEAAVDVKLSVRIDAAETQGIAFISVSGARKECNTPEYFRMTADCNGYASRVIYLQGVHYNSNMNSVLLEVRGKEQLESAKASPESHFEWETGQEDYSGQPFVLTDDERFNVARIEFVVPDDTYCNGENPNAPPVATKQVGVSDARPTVFLDTITPIVNGQTAAVTLSGSVKDLVADNVAPGAGADIDSVEVFVDDVPVTSAAITRSTDGEPGFWRKYPYRGTFGPITVTIPLTEGLHVVKVKSSENALGKTGETTVPIALGTRALPGGISGNGTSLAANIFLPSAPSPFSADTVKLYYGERAPQANDPLLTEKSVDVRFVCSWGTPGSANGQFELPADAVVDGAGNVYVLDQGNNRIQKFNKAGSLILTWGTPGDADGQLMAPRGIGADSSGAIYVADTGNSRVQKFTSEGVFVLKFGSAGTGNGQFDLPSDVVADSTGNVYVVDQGNSRIQKFTSDGTFVLQWGSYGLAAGQFDLPTSLTIDGEGNLYVTDTNNSRVQKFSASGQFLLKWGVRGVARGQLDQPLGIAVSGSSVYVCEAGNSRLQRFDNQGNSQAVWGSAGGDSGTFDFSTGGGVAVGPNGRVYVADSGNCRVQKFIASETCLSVVKIVGAPGLLNGQFNLPIDVVADDAGNIFVLDSANDRVQKFDKAGNFVLSWGGSGNDIGRFSQPKGLGIDAAGNIYVADTGNDRVQKFTSSGTFVATFGSTGAGNGYFSAPADVCVDAGGSVYVADANNQRIQKFTADGVFICLWGTSGSGNGQFSGPRSVAVGPLGHVYVSDSGNNRVQVFDNDGTYICQRGMPGQDSGEFNAPAGIAVDPAGHLYVSEAGNQRVQRFGSSGSWEMLWGSGGTGDGHFNFGPGAGLTVDQTGRLIVADGGNNRIHILGTAEASLTFRRVIDYALVTVSIDSTFAGLTSQADTLDGTIAFVHSDGSTSAFQGGAFAETGTQSNVFRREVEVSYGQGEPEPPADDAVMNIYFAAAPTNTTIDSIKIYGGARGPQADDLVLSELAGEEGSSVFHAVVAENVLEDDKEEVVVTIADFGGLTEQVDTLTATYQTVVNGEIVGSVQVAMTETDATSNIFRATAGLEDNAEGPLAVVWTAQIGMASSNNPGRLVPFSLRLMGPDDLFNDSSWTVDTNGAEVGLVRSSTGVYFAGAGAPAVNVVGEACVLYDMASFVRKVEALAKKLEAMLKRYGLTTDLLISALKVVEPHPPGDYSVDAAGNDVVSEDDQWVATKYYYTLRNGMRPPYTGVAYQSDPRLGKDIKWANEFTVNVDRFIKSGGSVTAAMRANGVISTEVRLRMLVTNTAAPMEVYFNMKKIADVPQGDTRVVSLIVSSLDLKLAAARGAKGARPNPAGNAVGIWSISPYTVKWIELSFDAMSPYILVHGKGCAGVYWQAMRPGETTPHWPSYVDGLKLYDIPHDNSISLSAKQKNISNDTVLNQAGELNERLKVVVPSLGTRHINLTCHSKGGLDSRFWLTEYNHNAFGGADVIVGQFITVCTPHRGSVIADGVVIGEYVNQVDITANAAYGKISGACTTALRLFRIVDVFTPAGNDTEATYSLRTTGLTDQNRRPAPSLDDAGFYYFKYAKKLPKYRNTDNTAPTFFAVASNIDRDGDRSLSWAERQEAADWDATAYVAGPAWNLLRDIRQIWEPPGKKFKAAGLMTVQLLGQFREPLPQPNDILVSFYSALIPEFSAVTLPVNPIYITRCQVGGGNTPYPGHDHGTVSRKELVQEFMLNTGRSVIPPVK